MAKEKYFSLKWSVMPWNVVLMYCNGVLELVCDVVFLGFDGILIAMERNFKGQNYLLCCTGISFKGK